MDVTPMPIVNVHAFVHEQLLNAEYELLGTDVSVAFNVMSVKPVQD